MKTIFLIFLSFASFSQNYFNGFVKDSISGEPLIGVNISVLNEPIGTNTNNYGYFVIKANSSKKIKLSIIGYKTKEMQIEGISPIIYLSPQSVELQEIIVSTTKEKLNTNIGILKLSGIQIKNISALIGEKDAIKAFQLMPGVQKGVEGSTALFVRGGTNDQNLILLDDAVIYNPNHFFGLFSAFNTDAIKEVTFQKGGFAAKYGGRASSVVDITMKDGNSTNTHGEGGIGLLASRIMVEGPIKKSKSSFLLAARRTTLDPILQLIQDKKEPFTYRFFDINVKINFDFNLNNKLFISGFLSDDELVKKSVNENNEKITKYVSNLGWGNKSATLRWIHLFNNRIFSNTTFTFANFKSEISDLNEVFLKTNNETYIRNTKIASEITDFTLKTDFEILKNEKINYQTGFFTSIRNFKPNIFTNSEKSSELNYSPESKIFRNIELGAYFTFAYKLKSNFELNTGMRVVNFYIKPKNYFFLEPRLSASYNLLNNKILKFGYARMNQPVNLLGASGFGLSTDFWVPATETIKPQQSDNLSIGYEQYIFNKNLTFGWEIFGKRFSNLLSFKDGVSLVVVEDIKKFNWEENVTTGQGIAFGNEFFIKKNEGNFTGWISYTFAKVINKFDELNSGKPFFPIQDRRHDVSIVTAYSPKKTIKFATTWIFTTGNPVTLPLGYYNSISPFSREMLLLVNYYGGKNTSRFPNYHRLDLSIALYPKKKRKYFESNWEFGVYNAYFRKNPFDAFLKIDNSLGKDAQLKVSYGYFLPIIPSINYNFKF